MAFGAMSRLGLIEALPSSGLIQAHLILNDRPAPIPAMCSTFAIAGYSNAAWGGCIFNAVDGHGYTVMPDCGFALHRSAAGWCAYRMLACLDFTSGCVPQCGSAPQV